MPSSDRADEERRSVKQKTITPTKENRKKQRTVRVAVQEGRRRRGRCRYDDVDGVLGRLTWFYEDHTHTHTPTQRKSVPTENWQTTRFARALELISRLIDPISDWK